MKDNKEFRLAVVGTDSLRGKEIKHVLSKKGLFFQKIDFFDPDVEEEYSKLTEFQGEPRVIMPLDDEALNHVDLVFLASDKKANTKYGKLASKHSFSAIDLSEIFNQDTKIPIVVSGINDRKILSQKPPLIANPHPVSIILSHLIQVIQTEFGVKKTLSCVLQPASAFEESGMEELANQSLDIMNGASVTKKVFKTQAAFNLLSQIDKTDDCGFSSKERQISREIQRILEIEELFLSLSMVQAPVFHTYSIMSYLELKKKADVPAMSDLFKQSANFKFLPPSASCPVSSVTVAGEDKIHIGQIKKEDSIPNAFWIWTVADNLTFGSALNAFDVAQSLAQLS